MSENLLEVKNLTATLNVLRGREYIDIPAVRGVPLSIATADILGIVGESGSGKSVSTLAVPGLLGANAKVSGNAFYNGVDLLTLSAKELKSYRGQKIGMIFQEPGRSFDPLQNMGSVFFEAFKTVEPSITKEAAFERAAALLEETGLTNAKERLANYPHQFSGGQLQRIGIALALAQGCELLVADEPTTALDVTIQAQIVSLLLLLRQKRNISIIFISHNIDLVSHISDRMLVMYGGMIMESGTTDEVSKTPCHPYTKALLAAAPSFGSHYSKTRLISIPGKVTDPAHPTNGCPFAPRCTQACAECSTPAFKERKCYERT
ncbi:MAG: ABC transporter ATP-binding protein [Treponemataceae bacterium]|nr:ABC transporter ATP-binding protein [Treponemataceae bacterium]